jgi:hypothetical protein
MIRDGRAGGTCTEAWDVRRETRGASDGHVRDVCCYIATAVQPSHAVSRAHVLILIVVAVVVVDAVQPVSSRVKVI